MIQFNSTYRRKKNSPYDQIMKLNDQGFSQAEMARKLGKTRQAISALITYHCIRYVPLRKYSIYSRLQKKGLTDREIAEKIGVKVTNLRKHLRKHPELPRPKKEAESKYNRYISLVERGLTAREIAEKLGVSVIALRSRYYKHPELPRPKKDKRGIKKGTIINSKRYGLIKSSLEKKLNITEIAEIINTSHSNLLQYFYRHEDLKKIWEKRNDV